MRNFETDTIGQPLPLSYSLPAKPTRVPNWIAWPLILVMICLTFGPIFMLQTGLMTLESRRPNKTFL